MPTTTTSNYLANIFLDASKIRNKDKHLLADIVELSCLQSPDHQIPLDEALDEQLGGNESIGGIVDIDSSSDEYDIFSENEIKSTVTKNDRLAFLLREIQNHLDARTKLFKDDYPFILEDNFISLKEEHTQQHKFYVFMLLSSNLCFLERSERLKFTEDFEITAAVALKEFFPHWKLKIFGTSNYTFLDKFCGTPREKMEKFAKDVGLRLTMDEEELKRYETPNGDAGIDVVAWYPFNDCAAHMPVFLAQVGCTADESSMFNKQFSVHPSLWKDRFRGLTALCCMITPQCYRDTNNTWPCFTSVQSVFIDRSRVLNLLSSNVNFQLDLLQTYSAVESIFASDD